jgi:RNA polymerase sigma-70 factor (ECF subfamily)
MEPGGELLSSELRAAVEQAVLALPDTLRAAFVLREIEGLSTREAADTLGIGESALKVRVHRARQALRETLASYLHDSATTQGATP